MRKKLEVKRAKYLSNLHLNGSVIFKSCTQFTYFPILHFISLMFIFGCFFMVLVLENLTQIKEPSTLNSRLEQLNLISQNKLKVNSNKKKYYNVTC